MEERDRNFGILRKVAACALLPHRQIGEAFALVAQEAEGTPFSQLIRDVRPHFLEPEFISCNGTSRSQDAAVMTFLQAAYKIITTGHPRPIIWTYIGENTVICTFFFIGGQEFSLKM